MIRFLTIYNSYVDIEKEIIELVYHGHLSYIDCQYMDFSTRKLWKKELQEIFKEQSTVSDSNTLNII